ncbi:PH domain-containing protein [Streptomyces sp. NPDC085927]|uniref:PH domain-containing protein n=1 Tax=Streptomyces sp. NPDC085927 TaxID=3365738 RepID=UPI0037D4250B
MTTPEPQPSDREPAEPAQSTEPAEHAGSAPSSEPSEPSAASESPAASEPADPPAAASAASGASEGPEGPAGSESRAASEPEYADRVYRSTSGFVGGALILALACWLGVDAVVVGEGNAPWLALAALLFLVPLVAAYTLVPAVYANEDRLRVRNPFRTITLPWGRVVSLRSAYTNEVVSDDGGKYQLWALPVSLRARKRASRRDLRAVGDRALGAEASLGGGAARRGGSDSAAADRSAAVERARTDRSMDELRELHESRGAEASAQGEVSVRWSYGIIAPSLAGAVLLAVLLGLG